MKKIIITTALFLISATVFCQDTDAEKTTGEKGGFKKHLLFTGGGINLGFWGGGTILGATPQLGYNVANWLDAGILFGYTYIGQRDINNNKLRQTIIGPGAFVRLFPIDGLFVTGQFERNFIRYKEIYTGGGSNQIKYAVSSLLLGAGYASGRMGQNTPYYYFSVSLDVLRDIRSPYTDRFNNVLPVVNAGFNIPLFQGSR
jgi:hypothetical protein